MLFSLRVGVHSTTNRMQTHNVWLILQPYGFIFSPVRDLPFCDFSCAVFDGRMPQQAECLHVQKDKGFMSTGYRTILVLTGSTSRDDLKHFAYRPDVIVNSIADLLHPSFAVPQMLNELQPDSALLAG